MKYILKNSQAKRYKGIIVEPEIRDFFIGKIWSRENPLFQERKWNNISRKTF